jgi:hypothetical protein
LQISGDIPDFLLYFAAEGFDRAAFYCMSQQEKSNFKIKALRMGN